MKRRGRHSNWHYVHVGGQRARRIAVGLVLVTVGAALFWLGTFGWTSPHERPGDFYSSWRLYTNDPAISPHVQLLIGERRSEERTCDRSNADLFISFGSGPLSDGFRWALIGNQNLAFSIVGGNPDDSIAGQFAGQMVESCTDDQLPLLSESLLVGNADEAWIPGLTGRAEASTDSSGETSFYLAVTLPYESMRYDDVDAYAYTVGWFGQAATDLAGNKLGRYGEECIDAPDIGQVATQASEQFEVTVYADNETDRVLYSQPVANGQGSVTWERPAGVVEVTFENGTRRKVNTALIFIAGILCGIGTGLWTNVAYRKH